MSTSDRGPGDRRLGYRWNLRQLMAGREMYSTTDLVGPLRERGIELSAAQVYRLVAQTPERLNLKVLVALCDILDCSPSDLVEPVAEQDTISRKTASAGDASKNISGRGQDSVRQDLRPRRARITDDDSAE